MPSFFFMSRSLCGRLVGDALGRRLQLRRVVLHVRRPFLLARLCAESFRALHGWRALGDASALSLALTKRAQSGAAVEVQGRDAAFPIRVVLRTDDAVQRLALVGRAIVNDRVEHEVWPELDNLRVCHLLIATGRVGALDVRPKDGLQAPRRVFDGALPLFRELRGDIFFELLERRPFRDGAVERCQRVRNHVETRNARHGERAPLRIVHKLVPLLTSQRDLLAKPFDGRLVLHRVGRDTPSHQRSSRTAARPASWAMMTAFSVSSSSSPAWSTLSARSVSARRSSAGLPALATMRMTSSTNGLIASAARSRAFSASLSA